MAACASTGYWRGLWVWSGRWSRRCWSRTTRSWCRVRPRRRDASRCGVCGRRARGYDRGEGARRWRALDLGSTKAFVEAEAPRVECRRHGVVVARTAWARHGSRFTQVVRAAGGVAGDALLEERDLRADADQLAARSAGSSNGSSPTSGSRQGDPLEGLTRIGIDELSFRKGQRYITVVVDHDTGRLVWAAEGRDKQTVLAFFDQLGAERAARIRLVSSDLGEWITRAVLERCPGATLCLDPYHVVALASSALDEVRREVWQQARRAGDTTGARWLKGARWALWKRPERLTERQQAKLATIEHVNRRLYRAYLLKEQLRLVFHSEPRRGRRAARGMARLGAPLPDRELRQARQDDHREQDRDRRHPHPPALERPDRSDQHHPAADHSPRLRLPLRPSADRARHAHRRRPPTRTPRPRMNPRKRQELPLRAAPCSVEIRSKVGRAANHRHVLAYPPKDLGLNQFCSSRTRSLRFVRSPRLQSRRGRFAPVPRWRRSGSSSG